MALLHRHPGLQGTGTVSAFSVIAILVNHYQSAAPIRRNQRSASAFHIVLFVIVVLISQAVKATEQLKQNEKYEICFKHSDDKSHVCRPS
jgi:hypothetical protein